MREKLLRWYNENKRDLPWRRRSGAYAVLVSEMMLQQTTVETVLRYYEPFLERFPDVQTLAAADDQEVLSCWKGLGYYTRARNLHRIAKQVTGEFGGVFPETHEGWLSLPGVGPYMAGAVLSIAYGQPYPAVDGNVLRVISRVFALREDITRPSARKEVETRLGAMMTNEGAGDFTQALMELGALICRPSSPGCASCPWQADCAALRERIVDELPVRKPRTAPRTIELWAAIIETADSVLLHYRGGDTLLAKLWGLPVVEKREGETPEALFAKKYSIALTDGKVTDHAVHVFTHQRWEMDIVQYHVEDKSSIQLSSSEWEWMSWESIEVRPIPTAFMRVLRAVRKQRAEGKADE